MEKRKRIYKTNNLTQRAKEVFKANKLKGFHETKEHRAVYLMLIVSELSEPLDAAWMDSCCDSSHLYEEHFPEKIKDTHEDEIADALIRILDYCGNFGIDIESHVRWKLEYNKSREQKHGKKY